MAKEKNAPVQVEQANQEVTVVNVPTTVPVTTESIESEINELSAKMADRSVSINDRRKISLDIEKLYQKIARMEAEEKLAEITRKNDEARNAEISKVQNLLVACGIIELPYEAKQAYDEVITAVLAKFPAKISGVKKVVTGDLKEPKGTKSAAIIAEFLRLQGEGMNETDIRKLLQTPAYNDGAGYNDGTIGNAIVGYKRANGLQD